MWKLCNNAMHEQAQQCIESHANQAFGVSFIPFISVPIVYGVCAKMIVQLDKIFGIPTVIDWDSEIVGDIFAGFVAAPALMIPLLGAGFASAYVKSIGQNYTQAIACVLAHTDMDALQDPKQVTHLIKEELHKIHAAKRENRIARKRLSQK